MGSRPRLARLANRRALQALGLAVLAVSTIVWVTRRDEEAPYTPGAEVEGISDVHKRDAVGAGWSVRFKDEAAASGLGFRHFSTGVRSTQLPEDMGSGCAFGDYDGDGDFDLFVADVAGPVTLSPEELRAAPGGCRLYRNDGGRFTDVTAEAGLAGLKGTYMAGAWGDYDNDGHPDLAVSSFGGLRLFHNRGDGTFVDVTRAAGFGGHTGFYTGLSWSDPDGDGLLDLYVCGYVDYRFDPKDRARLSKLGPAESPFTVNPESYPPIPNLFFRNLGKGRFRESAVEAGLSNPEGRSLAAAWADLDNDGRPDLYVANDVSEGALFVNAGDGLFESRGHEAHVADYRGAMGIAVGDPDGDGALDLFVTHWIAEANAFYLNKLARTKKLDFEDAAERFGLGHVSTDDIAWGAAFLDADADGLVDLVVANGSTFEEPRDRTRLVPMPLRLFRNTGPKGYVDVAPMSGPDVSVPRVHRGLAIADVDGDLREEIAVVVHGGPLLLLKAQGGPASHRVAFRCEGRRSNRSGFGARLTVEAGGRKAIQEIGSGASYLSQHAPEAIFGLGTVARVDAVTVRWPSGLTSTFRDLPADRRYLLVEGESPRALGAAQALAPPAAALSRETTLAFWGAVETARAETGKANVAAAIDAWKKALEIDPRHEDAHYALGNLLLVLGDREGARRELEALLEIEPKSQRGHGALGDLLADPASGARRDLVAARRHYEAAGAIYHEETGWVVRTAEVALGLGDRVEAEKILHRVLISNPRSFQALYFLGYLGWERGDAKEARRLFDASLAALGPQVSPAPGEGDLRKATVTLPSRGVFAPHWAFLASRAIRLEEAYANLKGSVPDRGAEQKRPG